MSRVAERSLWTPRRPRWTLVIVTVAGAALSPVFSALGTPGVNPARYPVIPAMLGLALLVLQLRHSFAAVRGERPRGGLWTLSAMAVLVYVPLPWFGWNWLATQQLLAASALMVLRGRVAIAVVGALALGTAAGAPIYDALNNFGGVLQWAFSCGFWLFGFALAAVLYGATWLVRTADALQSARTELAELAIGRERLRVTRDLHDLIGQSLSAVSLKGDLAMRLLSGDPAAARSEIVSLTAVARDALGSVRAITRDVHVIDLRTELDGAAGLLAAAGVAAHIEVMAEELTAAAQKVFAWAVREGVTNVLRHSNARECSISINREGTNAILRIGNDGAPDAAGTRTGLAGLAERAQAASGRMSAERTAGGQFCLMVEIPVGAA